VTDLLSVSEVATRTGQIKSSVFRDIRSGLLPARKKRGYKGRMGRVFISRDDYREYLATIFKPLS